MRNPNCFCILLIDYCTQEVNSIKIGQGNIYIRYLIGSHGGIK